MLSRRGLIAGLSATGLAWPAGAASLRSLAVPPAPRACPGPLRASPDLSLAMQSRAVFIAGVRPYRAGGYRTEADPAASARKMVIHNYGHGGSGWSLSWGSAKVAVELALATREKQLAVIGCGAIGLTSARVAQRAGLRVRIYCRERPPEVRSSAATGVWSPDSRICTEDGATPAFRRQWEAMARYSFRRYQSLLGLPGEPVQWRDGYVLSDTPFGQPMPDIATPEAHPEPDYPDLEALLGDLRPRSQPLTRSQHPFPVPHVRRYTQMVFNLASYSQLLMDEFMRDGGDIAQREFFSPRDFAALKERTLINATGYGARALLGDESVIPVRGQTARLIPQLEVNYGLTYRGHNLFMVPRRDGILVQAQTDGDFGNADSTPDRAASDAAVLRLAALFAS